MRSKSWLSEIIKGLEERGLLKKEKRGRKIGLSNNYETRVLLSLMDDFSLEKLFCGKKEDILRSLPKSIAELEKHFSKSMIYQSIKDFEEAGVVIEREGKFSVVSTKLNDFLKATSFAREEIGKGEREGGVETAFSRFAEYGVQYYPKYRYFYKGEDELSISHILAHALALAEDKKQFSICCIFYLKNRTKIDDKVVRELALRYGCLERWFDVKAYLSRREEEIKNKDLFLPWVEVVEKARVYGINLAEDKKERKHSSQALEEQLELLGRGIEKEVEVYLLGGANLIFRSLKDSTKDIDVVVKERSDFEVIEERLKNMGYEKRVEMVGDIKSFVLEKEGAPRFDIFVSQVCRGLILSATMIERSERIGKGYGKLKVYLLSPTDISLLKCVTEREGDMEDVGVMVKKGEMDWKALMKEIEEQERATGTFFSFSVLDTVEILEERSGIKIPVMKKLCSYCLEKALLISLVEPKTIKELKKEVEFPEHLIYNKLKKLEKEGKIKVDRAGKLNRYVVVAKDYKINVKKKCGIEDDKEAKRAA
jgi:hypothetical protein